MRMEINPRGNGACPLCARRRDCRVQRLLSESVVKLDGTEGSEGEAVEIVVYACPYFKEKV
jgi:hypothetical protein